MEHTNLGPLGEQRGGERGAAKSFSRMAKGLPRRIPDIDQLVFAGEFDTTSAQDNDNDNDDE
jgi:hypothetical protein